MKVIKPNSPDQAPIGVTIFLAGSIEMGAAEDWQQRVSGLLADYRNTTIFNPRRDDWDSSWGQTLEDENFVGQVTWELQKLEEADLIFFYFDPATKSPISLLEFGMYARCNPEKVICCAPDGFYRKGNLQVTGLRYGVEVHDDLTEALEDLRFEMHQTEREKYDN